MRTILSSKRVLLTGFILGIVILLWFQFLFREQKRNLDSIEDEIRDTEARVATWVEETRNMSEYQQKFVILEEERQRLLSEIPAIQQVDRLSQHLIDMGKNNGCVVTYLGIPFAEFFSKENRMAASPGNEILVLPLKMIVDGDFASLGRFVEALSDLPFFTAFGELELSRRSEDEDELEMNFSMMVFLKRNDSKRMMISER